MDKLLKKDELSKSTSLQKAFEICNKYKIIHSFYRIPNYNDEPKLYIYSAKLNKTDHLSDAQASVEKYTGGVSFDPEKAALKTLGEAIERYCLSIYKNKSLVKGSASGLVPAIHLNNIVNISDEQKPHFKNFSINKNSIFYWTKGYSLTEKRSVFIPAQLVYTPYDFSKEKIIRFPITTGAASGTSLAGSIIRGIFEIVERDSLMITYLNKLNMPKVNLNKDGELALIRRRFKKYLLDLFVFDITTDLNIPVALTVIIDKTGKGPAVSLGLKSHTNFRTAIIGSIEEAQHVRPWIRDEISKGREINKLRHIHSIIERGIFWSDKKMIKHLNFLLKSSKFSQRPLTSNKKGDYKLLRNLIIIFKKKNYHIYFADVTQPEIKNQGFYVTKTIIPELQPLYLDEQVKYLGGKRLRKVPKILGLKKNGTNFNSFNKIPHPFL